jgi:TrmH family RNA methyltransferase
MFIESADNKIIKQIVSLKDKKTRDADGLFIVEGEKQVNDIPLNWEVKYAVLTDNNAKINFSHVYYTTEKIFKKISDTATPQGILAVVKIPDYNLSEVLSVRTGLYIIIDSLQDPGNLGTIIRTAHAYGVKAFLYQKTA